MFVIQMKYLYYKRWHWCCSMTENWQAMTRVPAPGQDTSKPNLEEISKFPLKPKSYDQVSKKCHSLPKTGSSEQPPSFDCLPEHPLCWQGEFLQLLRWGEKKKTDRNPTQTYLANSISVALRSAHRYWAQSQEGCNHIWGNTSSSALSEAHQRPGGWTEAQITAHRATHCSSKENHGYWARRAMISSAGKKRS